LKQWWFDVSVVYAGDESKLSKEAATALAGWRDAGGEILQSIPEGKTWDLAIDGLFGLGLERPLEGRTADIVTWVNGSGIPVLSMDMPSGLHTDSGRVLGSAIRALRTVTFIGLKAGLFTLDGPDYAGDVHFDSVGVEPPASTRTNGWRIESALVAS